MQTVDRPRPEVRKLIGLSIGGAVLGAVVGGAIGLLMHATPAEVLAYGLGCGLGGGVFTAAMGATYFDLRASHVTPTKPPTSQ